MEEFRVPQRQVEVSVHLLDGQNLDGLMFVPALGPDGEPGRLIDRLNLAAEDFLPLQEKDSSTHLIQEHRILTVRVPNDEVEEGTEKEIEDSQYCQHCRVEFRLTSGLGLKGHLYFVQPQNHLRLCDYLNSGKRFIPLHAEGGLIYVNREQIISARSFEDNGG